MNDSRPSKFGPRWYHVCLSMMAVGLLVLEMFVFFFLVGWLLSMVTALIIVITVVLVRHRFRFGLRTLLSFVLLAGVPLGLLFGTKVQRLTNERNAVAEIQRMGGSVTFGVLGGDPTGFLP